MTRDEVVKGLETHVRIVRGVQQSCNGCPLKGKGSVIDDRYAAWYASCVDQLLEAILALLKAEPKRGRWTTHRTLEHDGEWYCSECGYEPTVYEGTPYCPNCGTRMGDDDNAD